MLFSSGDSPQNASSILSGEGFDEVQPGGSPFVVSAVSHLPTSLSSPEAAFRLHRLILRNAQRLPAKWPSCLVSVLMIISTTPCHLPQAVNLGQWPSMIEGEPCQISTWMTGAMQGNGFMGVCCRATFSAAGVLSTAMPLTTGVPTSTATAGGMAFDPASNILYYSTSLRAQGLDWIERGRSGGWDEGGEQTAQKKDADGQ